MQFLVVRQQVKANIFGQSYELCPIDSPYCRSKDILVADDGTAQELFQRHKGVLSLASFEKDEVPNFPKPLCDLGQIEEGSTILLLRSGGIGDHIMFMPALNRFRKALAKKAVKLWLAMQKDMFPIFMNNPFVDRLCPLPIRLSEFLQADYVVDFSGCLDDAIGPDLHLTDYYTERLGLEPGVSCKEEHIHGQILDPSLRVNEQFQELRHANPKRLFVLLNWFASTHIKSLPPSILSTLTKEFADIAFLVAHPQSLNGATEDNLKEHKINAINISSQMENLYDYFTAIRLSDAVICSDTSAYHIASLYGKPSVVVTGPTYPVLTKYYPYCSFVRSNYKGETCASPCGRTKGTCPEAGLLGTAFSPCLASMSARRINEGFQRVVDTYFSTNLPES